MRPNEFISKIAPMAQRDMSQHRILASLTIAQAILESSWGESGLTKAANNLFGIKGKHNGQGYVCGTFEYIDGKRVNIKAEFRKYPSWLESMNDHSAFLHGVKLGNGRRRYEAVIGETDYKKACKAIQAAGYATAPNYADVLIGIIEDYKLYQYDKISDAYANGNTHRVRVGNFKRKADADNARQAIVNLSFWADGCTVEPSETARNEWQVNVQPFKNADTAKAAVEKIKRAYGWYCEVKGIRRAE